jgi:hypothetical protein
VRLALPAPLVPPALREHKVSKVPSVRRVPSGSEGRLVLWDRLDRSDRRVRREKPVAKAQLDPPASADRQDRKAPPAHLVPRAPRARRVTPARDRQFASSLVQIASAAKMTKCWLVLFARAVRPTERGARRRARRQPVYVCAGEFPVGMFGRFDLIGRTARPGARSLARHGDSKVRAYWLGERNVLSGKHERSYEAFSGV